MELTEKIKQLAADFYEYSKNAEKILNELNRLRLLKQPSNVDFYKDVRGYVDINISNRDYTFILGGDGRSTPWDETRHGIVAVVTIKQGVYLSDTQKKILKDFINNTDKVDHIMIIDDERR